MTVSGMALALLLARTCVAEISFVDEEGIRECELMWSISQRNAIRRGRTLTRQTMLFNSYWKCDKKPGKKTPKCYYQIKNRPWIKHLNGAEKPKYWPQTMRWSMWRDKWLGMRRAAEDWLKQRRLTFHGCDHAIDYGAPGEIPSMSRMEMIKCLPNARQRYWQLKRGKNNELAKKLRDMRQLREQGIQQTNQRLGDMSR